MNAAERPATQIAALPCGHDSPEGPAIADALRDSGLAQDYLVLAPHPAEPQRLMQAHVAIGRASLPAGCVFEWHVTRTNCCQCTPGHWSRWQR